MANVWGNTPQSPAYSLQPNWTRGRAYITIGATGAPTIASGPPGVTISRTSAGLYALVFPVAIRVIPSYSIVLSANIIAVHGTAISQTAGTASFTTTAGTDAAVATDPGNGDILAVLFDVQFGQ